MKVLIFHASAGHGHKKVAEVIDRELIKKGIAADHAVVHDALDLTPAFFRKGYPGIYYYSVKHTPDMWGWSYELLDRPFAYRCLAPIRKLGNSLVGKKILEEVVSFDPDAIVCTHFLTAELLSRAKLNGKIRAKIIVVITDYRPHTFWVNPGTDTYWVMSDEGKLELIERGISADRIRAGGIPVDPIFKPNPKRNELLHKYEIDPDRLTVLITSGSFGLGPQEELLESLKKFQSRIQCLVVCGNNKEMLTSLQQKKYDYPVKLFGFVDFMDELMEVSDLMIAKPGGSTTTESLCKGLPMVVMDPIPGQESRNVEIMKKRNTSFFIKKPEQIQTIVETILKQPELLTEKKRNIADLAKPNAAEDFADYVIQSDSPRQ